MESFSQIDNANKHDFIDDLLQFMRRSIFTNSTLAPQDVTLQQVNTARKILDQLVKKVQLEMDTAAFNRDLIQLFLLIPRKIKRVKDHLIEPPSTAENLREIEQRLATEQARVDALARKLETL